MNLKVGDFLIMSDDHSINIPRVYMIISMLKSLTVIHID